MKRNDVHAVRLLLDFQADPNLLIENRSMLSVAAHYGFAEITSLLLDSGALIDNGIMSPLLSVLKSGSRPVFMALVIRDPKILLSVFNGKPFIYHAIVEKTTLLPIIATLVKTEIEKLEKSGISNRPSFPPEGLTSSQKKRLQSAIERKDSVTTTNMISEKKKALRSLWYPITPETFDGSQFSSILDQSPSISSLDSPRSGSQIANNPVNEAPRSIRSNDQ